MKGDDTGGIVGLIGAIFGVGGVGLGAMLRETMRAKAKQPADLATALANFSSVLNDNAGEIIKTLKEERDELRLERKELLKRVEALEEENLQCRGDNAQMAQRFESLAAFLRRHGINIPDGGLTGSFVTLDGDNSTVLQPMPKP